MSQDITKDEKPLSYEEKLAEYAERSKAAEAENEARRRNKTKADRSADDDYGFVSIPTGPYPS